MSDDSKATWVATLSDGTTAVEHKGSFQLIAGQRKPWPRLVEYVVRQNLQLTSLRLNFKGRTIHLPRPGFERFDRVGLPPLSYSLCYHIEAVAEFGSLDLVQTLFVELTAHYEDYAVSYIQDVTNEKVSWIVVTDERKGLAETPRVKDA